MGTFFYSNIYYLGKFLEVPQTNHLIIQTTLSTIQSVVIPVTTKHSQGMIHNAFIVLKLSNLTSIFNKRLIEGGF